MRKACALALLWLSAPAYAGRSNFGAVQSTEVVGDHNVELESRLVDRNDVGSLHERSTTWWLAPAVGLSSRLELQLPVELAWRSEIGSRTDFTFSRFGADVRYRPSQRWPALVRASLSRDVVRRNLGRIELDVALAHDIGSVHLAANAGITFEANPGGVHLDARPAAGVSVAIKPDVRVGAEAFGLYSFDSAVESWAAIGPSLAFTHGRFWFATSIGIGVHNISSAGQLNWGIGF
jgi:hypothetical protein